MKNYNKPTVNVVNLSVKENIASLPKGAKFNAGINGQVDGYNKVTMIPEVVYTIAEAESSAPTVPGGQV